MNCFDIMQVPLAVLLRRLLFAKSQLRHQIEMHAPQLHHLSQSLCQLFVATKYTRSVVHTVHLGARYQIRLRSVTSFVVPQLARYLSL